MDSFLKPPEWFVKKYRQKYKPYPKELEQLILSHLNTKFYEPNLDKLYRNVTNELKNNILRLSIKYQRLFIPIYFKPMGMGKILAFNLKCDDSTSLFIKNESKINWLEDSFFDLLEIDPIIYNESAYGIRQQLYMNYETKLELLNDFKIQIIGDNTNTLYKHLLKFIQECSYTAKTVKNEFESYNTSLDEKIYKSWVEYNIEHFAKKIKKI